MVRGNPNRFLEARINFTMPPHAVSTMDMMEEVPEAPKKNLTVAINYEVSLVDEFVPSARKQRRGSTTVEAVPGSTAPNAATNSESTDLNRKDSNVENSAPNVEAPSKKRSLLLSPDSIRRSARDRQGKRDVSLARNQVKYDMHLVPSVRKNNAFLQSFPRWWMAKNDEKPANARRSSRLSIPDVTTGCCLERLVQVHPFEDDSSVVWIPSKRVDWEDSVSEMTAVCTSAGLHRYLAQQNPQKKFQIPLSRDYIRDRVDIDDPLNGLQIRHKDGGWLQGFLLWTNFTTWTHYFKWDSVHPQSGVQATDSALKADRDGSLSNELEACTRSGDPMVGGIVFPEIAEIALVGGLGCGEYVLRMALDSIRAAQKYHYVVLQATNDSKGFYERFGFVRVGAICRYANSIPSPGNENPVVGYRHWTHPNESDASLQLHGGPSYMMCLKLPRECSSCGRSNCDVVSENSFLNNVLELAAVDQKPTVEQLGGSASGPKSSSWKSANSSVASAQSNTSSNSKRKPGRPPSKPSSIRKKAIVQFSDDEIPTAPATVTKRRFSNRPGSEPTSKRRKSNNGDSYPDEAMTSLADGSYAQKQQESESSDGYPMEGVNRSESSQERTRGSTKKEASTTKKTPQGADKKDRLYHSVRGPDGRFVRVPIDGTEEFEPAPKAPLQAPARRPVGRPPRTPASTAATSSKRALSAFKPKPKPKASPKAAGPKRVNRAELRKQKVKAYPRGRLHFYNKVVKPIDGSKDYYFVLHYDEANETIQIVPMAAKGTCLGKHSGRPRYQCLVEETDENFRTEPTHSFQVVPATMVMKTSLVAQEAWDIQDSD